MLFRVQLKMMQAGYEKLLFNKHWPIPCLSKWVTRKVGNGKRDRNLNRNRNLHKKLHGQRQYNLWLVETLFTNISREDSGLTVILFTCKLRSTHNGLSCLQVSPIGWFCETAVDTHWDEYWKWVHISQLCRNFMTYSLCLLCHHWPHDTY